MEYCRARDYLLRIIALSKSLSFLHTRLYTSLNKEEEFRQYIDVIKLANKKKSTLLANITLGTGQVEDLIRKASYIKNRKTQDKYPFNGILRAA